MLAWHLLAASAIAALVSTLAFGVRGAIAAHFIGPVLLLAFHAHTWASFGLRSALIDAFALAVPYWP